MPAEKETPIDLLTRSFGCDPHETQHHFLVNIPRGITQKVTISEHFTWNEKNGSSPVTLDNRQDGQIRTNLAKPKWDEIADETRAEFNKRLKRMGKKTGIWRLGLNLIRPELGKELVLLAWAIEDADPGLIPNALANWKGLVPEERWWMYTQTAAATGHGIHDRGKGWRKAVRFALTENPVTTTDYKKPIVPEFFHIASRQMPLFTTRYSEEGNK